jgi:ATP-binding cassette, subfamily B, multidrug efflux pump
MEKTLWKNLKGVLSRYYLRLLRALVMVMIGNGLLVLLPLVFRHAIMQVSPQDTPPKEALGGVLNSLLLSLLGPYSQSVYAWALLLITLSIIAAYFKYQMRFAFISVSRDAERDLRSKLFSRIQEQSMAFYDRHSTGELLSRLTNDISIYRDVLGPGLMYPLLFLTTVVPGMIALFWLSPYLAGISTIPLVLIPLLNYFMRPSIYRASHAAQQGLADLSGMVQEHYSGIRIVKGYGIEPRLLTIFNALGRSLIKVNMKLNVYQGLLFPFFTMLTKMVTVLLVMLAGFLIFTGWQALDIADFASFMWIQSFIFHPVLMLAWVMPIYARGRASYERLRDVYEEPIEVKEGHVTQLVIPPKSNITFTHLSFAYPGTERLILDDVTLEIKSGTFVGIAGPVGGGKTTLFRLLNREYEIAPGQIAIGGHDIHTFPLQAFSKEIVTVEQLPFLFSRSIAENVRFGKEEAELAEVQLVAQFADLHETILDFPEQYETVIGERGLTLSGGQKQRVAIARAFLVDRSIVLLDDVFSAVDARTESRIFEAIQKNFKGKTLLLITHRLSILETMDRVIYMEDGRIVEDGTPEALKAMKGKYAAIFELQQLENS